MRKALDPPFVVEDVSFDSYVYDDCSGELIFWAGAQPADRSTMEIAETIEDHHLIVGEEGKVLKLMFSYPRMQLDEHGFVDVTLREGGPTTRLTQEVLAPFLHDTSPAPSPPSSIDRWTAAILARRTRRRVRRAATAAMGAWRAG